nr:MAG TPA: Pectate lyase [Caudoviricetes sp.]
MVNDGIGNGNFTTLKPFAFWTQHVLPLVYGDEISYMETLGKMRDILNELIKNNNNLPTYIQQMIEEYISSGAIESVIDKILSNFILNVKYPPTGVPKAKGDGTTNDHDSIQGCIDYAAGLGGGVVYLPAGKYLTSSLVLKPGVTLLGFGRYATSLILAGGSTTHLITGTVSDAGLVNLTLNAKMSSQVNRVDAVELVGNHIDIKNCIVKDCYTSINVQKTGSAINICDVICEVASDACLRIGGTDGGLLVDGLEMSGLSTNLGVAYIVTDSNGDIYRNINIHGTGALGIDVAGSQNYFDGKISGVTKDYEDLSGDNTFELFGKSSVKNYTNDVVENANAFSQVAANGIERQGANIGDNATNAYTVNANDVVLNPTNPLTYKTPTDLDRNFKSIKMKDSSNITYDVLVYKTPITGYNIFDTLADAVTSNLPVGTAFQTLGYLAKNDGGGLQYIVTSGGVIDGGSIVSYGVNTATAIMPDGVYPEYFGVSPTNATQWNNYLNYVNTTEGKYFRLYTKTYTIPVIFIAFKSIIGNEDYSNNIANITSASTLGVVSATQTTYLNYSLNTSCVVCCYNKNRGAELGHITFKNFTVTANGEQTAIFLADVSHFNMDNVLAKGGTESCFYIQGAWLCYFNNLNAQPNGSYGIVVGNVPRVASTGTTTCTFDSCFVESLSNTTAVCGWYFNGANSMTLNSCACDHIAGNANAYIFNYSEATLNACSVEDYRGTNALFNIFDSQISVNSFFGTNNKNASSMFLVRTKVTLTINGIKYTGTVTKPAVNIVYGTTDSTGIVVCNYNTAQLTNVSLPVYCEPTSTLHFYYKNEQEHGRYITNTKTLVTYA